MKIDLAPAIGELSGLSNLVGGDPPWASQNNPPPDYLPLDEDTRCEVAIVGAGVSGAIIASLLREAGLDVLLLDKHKVAHGSTLANTALLLYEADRPLCQLAEMIGEDNAVTGYRLSYEAIDQIARLSKSLPVDCHFERRPSLTIASRAEDVDLLRRDYAMRQKHGFAVRLLNGQEIRSQYGFDAPAALHAQQGAQMDPYCFTQQLIQQGAGRGMRVHEHTAIVEYRSDGAEATLLTDQGHRITAGHTIFATGYEAERYSPRRLAGDNSTYAILTEAVVAPGGWGDGATIWETARPYIFLRTTSDGRILIGGLDDRTADAKRRDAALESKSRQLLQRLKRMFPDLNPHIDHAWSGTFLNTRDSLPYIGQQKGFPGAWFALAYGGNGTTFAMIAAMLLRDQLLGRPHAALKLFRFDRPTAHPMEDHDK
jgi:glycine/D-amino acid oxidase-like deaminating enzyme